MTTWVLVLMLSNVSGGMTSIEGFKSKEDCIASGKEARENESSIIFVCIKKVVK